MGGAVAAVIFQLFAGLHCHGAVALHDPGGDLLVAVPGGILDDDAVLSLLGLGGSHTDAVVVVDLLDGDLSALLGDVVKAGLAGALGHVHHGLLAQLVGRPGNAAAMVAVGGGEEGGLAELFTESGAGEIFIGHLAHVPAHLLGNVAAHGKGAAQNLERVEAEAVGLILDIYAAQAQVLCHAVQLGKGSDGILGEAAVEGPRLRHVLRGHDGKLPVVAGGHPIGRPFNGILHELTS